MSRRRLSLGAGTLLVMALLLGVYAVLHSPLRGPIWDAFDAGCTMLCQPTRLGSEVFDALAAVWLIATAIVGGVALAHRAVTSRLERAAAAGLIAYGLVVVPAAIVAFVGDRVGVALLRPPLGPLLASTPAVLATIVAFRAGWRPSRPSPGWVRLTPSIVVLSALVVAAVIIQVGVAMRYPVTGFDDLGYHSPLAVLFWHDGSITTFLDRFGGTPVLSHPGGAELWQGLLLLIGGEPLAVGGQLPFAVLAATGVALFGRRLGLRTGAGVLAALLFMLAPMVIAQLGHLRNDVVGASLLVVTAALIAGGPQTTLPNRLTLGSVGIGLMLVTKLALLPAAGALGLVLIWLVLREHRSGRDMGPIWRAAGLGLLIIGLAVAPWWIRNLLHDGNPLFPLNLPLIGRGAEGSSPPDSRYVPSPLLWPIYPLIEAYGPADGLGGAYAVGILPGIVAALFLARRRPLLIVGILLLVSLPVLVLLDRREPRFLLGIAALTFALVPFALVALQRRWRTAAVSILVAASIVTVGAQWLRLAPDSVVERIAFYDKEWGIDPVAGALPEREGILLDDRCGGGFGRLYPWFGAGQERRLARVDCEGTTAQEILRLLRRERLTYVYLFVPPQDRVDRSALYPADAFSIEHESSYVGPSGTWDRVLYRWKAAPAGATEQEDEGPGQSPGDVQNE